MHSFQHPKDHISGSFCNFSSMINSGSQNYCQVRSAQTGPILAREDSFNPVGSLIDCYCFFFKIWKFMYFFRTDATSSKCWRFGNPVASNEHWSEIYVLFMLDLWIQNPSYYPMLVKNVVSINHIGGVFNMSFCSFFNMTSSRKMYSVLKNSF